MRIRKLLGSMCVALAAVAMSVPATALAEKGGKSGGHGGGHSAQKSHDKPGGGVQKHRGGGAQNHESRERVAAPQAKPDVKRHDAPRQFDPRSQPFRGDEFRNRAERDGKDWEPKDWFRAQVVKPSYKNLWRYGNFYPWYGDDFYFGPYYGYGYPYGYWHGYRSPLGLRSPWANLAADFLLGPRYGYGGFGYGLPYARYGVARPTTVVAQPPAAVANFIADGRASFRAGDYDAAIRAFQHALVDDPQNGNLMLLQAQTLFAKGQYDQAAGLVQLAMQVLPADQWGSVVRNYRELYATPGEFTRQLRALEAAVANENSPGLNFLLGYQYGYLGYPKEAVNELNKTIATVPQDAAARSLRDRMAKQAGIGTQALPASSAASPDKRT